MLNLSNTLQPDEAVYFADAVQNPRRHQSKHCALKHFQKKAMTDFFGSEMRKNHVRMVQKGGTPIQLSIRTSGRGRVNVHAALNLENF